MKTTKTISALLNAKQAITCFMVLVFVTASFSQDANEYTYKYRVTAYKKGEPAISSTSNIAEIIPALEFYIPNSFTPNNDGLNDKFGAIGEGIQEYKLQIFNVWGNLVFESKNPNDQWDGKHNGLMCAEGAYTYLIVATGETKRVRKSGTVSLIM